MANYSKLKVIWRNNLNDIYKDNTIIGVGQEAVINMDENGISNIYVNFKVNNDFFTDLVKINGNVIQVPFKTDVLKAGTHQLEIVAYLKNGDVVPSPTFSYYVEKSLKNTDDIKADTHYPVLIELLEKVEEWNERIPYQEEQRIANENERKSNEINRQSNENTRQLNESSRQQYETQRRVEEDERLTDEQVRVNAENIRIANENERLRKEIERQNAEELRQIAYNSSLYGRMDEAEDRLNAVNSQLAHIENNNNDIILYSFFENNEYPTKTNFFTSVDGFNLNKINNKDLIEARDPSIIYKNGYWLVACTSYNPHDFKIFKSKDFVNWSSYEISCGLYSDDSNHIWAPEWFENDNGDVYILISKKHDSAYDIDGKLINDFRPYLIKCNNIDKLTFDSPISINLESSNKIDGHIIKHNNIYNLFIKDEYDKWIEHWTSNNLTEWVKVKDKVLEFGQYVEGTCIVKYNNRFYAYNDSFKDDNGYMYCCVSDDLNNWSDRKLLNSTGVRLRHGSAYVLRSNNEKNILSKFIIFNMNNSSKITRNKIIDLENYVNDNNEIYDLELIDKAIYRIKNNQEYTLKSVNNANEVSEFYLIIGTNSVGSLTFDTDNSIIDLPNGLTYSAQCSDNDILIRFVYSESLKKFKPTTTSNSFLVDKYKLKKGGWKRQLISSTSTTIDELKVEDGVVYYVGGGVDVIINNVSSSVDGTHFYFLLNSGGAGSITINSGYNITVPNATYVISKNNNNNDCLIEFIKVNGTTFRLRK